MFDIDLASFNPELLVAAGVGLSALAIGAAALSPGSHQRKVQKRFERITKRARGEVAVTAAEASAAGSIRLEDLEKRGGFERFAIRYLPRQSVLKERLIRAGVNLTVGNYAMLVLGVVAAAATAVLLFTGLNVPTALLIGGAAGLGVPHLAIGFLIGRRRRRFVASFPEAIDLIVRGLKSGLPVSASLATVAEEFGDPLGSEFSKIVYNIRLGETLDGALWQTARRLDIPEFKFFVISLSIQQETGGNLTETLGNLSDLLRRRRQMKLKISALTGEGRASAMILSALPILMFGLINALNSAYAAALYTDKRGMILLGAAVFSMLIGIAIMVKLVKFEV